jgi:hypothetical protein
MNIVDLRKQLVVLGKLRSTMIRSCLKKLLTIRDVFNKIISIDRSKGQIR